MKRILTSTSLLAALVFGLACTGACTITTDDGGGEGEGDLSSIDSDLTIDGDVTIDGDINVNNGATLTIAPGTTIRMTSGHWLRVEDGVLKADGTAEDPITIRGVDDGEARFLGVDLRSGTRSGTSMSFVTFDGGGELRFGDCGCFSLVDVPADRVSLIDLTPTSRKVSRSRRRTRLGTAPVTSTSAAPGRRSSRSKRATRCALKTRSGSPSATTAPAASSPSAPPTRPSVSPASARARARRVRGSACICVKQP